MYGDELIIGYLKRARDSIEKDIKQIREDYKDYEGCKLETAYMEDHINKFSVLVRIDIHYVEYDEIKQEIYNRLKDIDYIIKLKITDDFIHFNVKYEKNMEINGLRSV